MKAPTILASCLLAATSAFASPTLTLEFSRSGSDAASVSISASGIEGVTASLNRSSHALKQLSSAAIICPNVNGKDSPTITLDFSITGLPADFKFNTVGLDLWGLNAAGNAQGSNDGVNRRFNIDVNVSGNEFASFTDLDPAAGIAGAHKMWTATSTAAAAATSPLDLSITITKGSANNGCFIGLQSITLSNDESGATTPEIPETPETPEGNIYTIKWKNNTDRYIAEDASGSLIATDYSTTNMLFWEFIPTGKENCFHIRNTASGNYIASCNLTPASASKIKTSKTPVEYYVGTSAATSGDNKGCVWLSSTDCANYSDESKSPRALNKDGASEAVITWQAGVGKVGSYWTLEATKDLYEVRPFELSPAIGNPTAEYYMLNAEGKAYTPAGTWETFNSADRNQRWYFIANPDSDTRSYKVVDVASNTAVSNGASFTVSDTNHSAPFSLIGANGVPFLEGITFVAGRAPFAMKHQIYQIPCGSLGDLWIARLTLGSLHYPMASAANGSLSYGSAPKPSNKYVILSRDAATLATGSSAPLEIELSGNPSADYSMALCIDWNRDGIFESVTELPCSRTVKADVEVPADTKLGKVRARIRLTSNGVLEPDGDVSGEILDLLINVVNPSDSPVDPVVKVNDPQRGSAVWANGTATATPAGNSIFLYWLEGSRIVSVEQNYAVEPSATPRELTAVFSANTIAGIDGIDSALLSKTDANASIRFDGSTVSVENASDVKAILLFSVSAARVAATAGNSLQIGTMAPGVYIVKAITQSGIVSAKIRI